MTSLFSEALREPLNGSLKALHSPDFDGTLLNFRLFLKLGAPSRLRSRGKLPLVPLQLSGPACLHGF